MSVPPLDVVILAAGQGKRMRSRRAKVLQSAGDRALVQHVLAAARALAPRQLIVVVGHEAQAVTDAVAGPDVTIVTQGVPRGTGHAVGCALPHLAGDARVLVLYGDVPLLRDHTLHALLGCLVPGAIALLTTHVPDPTGYGRIIRHDNEVRAIVEEKDASPEQRAVCEINTGILAAYVADLARWIPRLNTSNAQGEYYLTDIVALAVAEGGPILTHMLPEPAEVLGVNTAADLARAERGLQHRAAHALMGQGVRLRDPARIDVRGEVWADGDVDIDIDVILEGRVTLGRDVRIGPYCHLKNVSIEDGAVIESHCVLEDVRVGPGAHVGPFARLRPGTTLAQHSKVGNFVEIKNSEIGPHTKVNHLSYVGDARLGAEVNVGAGTITCNYDGTDKHRTVIEDGAFIGSGTELVAPLTVGAGATIGAGSTLTDDAPAHQLTLSRVRQRSVPGWRRPARKKPARP